MHTENKITPLANGMRGMPMVGCYSYLDGCFG